MEITIATAEQFFLWAAPKGWFAGRGRHHPLLPGFVYVEIADRSTGLKFQENWTESKGSAQHSAFSCLWFRGHPIWTMHLTGWFDSIGEIVIRQALAASFEAQTFHGGRGPLRFSRNGHRYENRLGTSTFDQFVGDESIIENGTNVRHGAAHFHGGWLLDPQTEGWKPAMQAQTVLCPSSP